MHEKLSQAVKLYDKLLTEHVSQPAWRTAATDSTPTYQQPQTGYNPSYQAVPQSYSQWAPDMQSQQPKSPQVQVQMQHVQQSYFVPSLPSTDQQVPVLNNAYVTSPVAESSVRQIYQPVQGPPQPSSPGQLYQPQQIQMQHYSPEPQQYSQPPAQYDSASSVPIASPQIRPSIPAGSVSFIQVSSPPVSTQSPQSSQVTQSSFTQAMPAHTPTPIRQNTISASSYTIAPPPPPAFNSVSQATHGAQQLQRLEQVSVPVQLPEFPAVPTGVPSSHAYVGYGPPVETERKEALLIDL